MRMVDNMILQCTHGRAVLFVALAALLWSSGGILIKLVDWHPLAIAGVRSGIAAVVIAAAFGCRNIQGGKVQLAGAAAYAAMVMLFVSATKLTTAANAILLQYTAPIYVALLGAWLLKEKTEWQDWLTIGAVFVGMGLFFMDHVSAGGLTGNLCGIASGISLALFVIFMRMQKDGSPYGSVMLGNLVTFGCSLPFIFTLDAYPDWTGWLGLLLLGFFQLGLSYVFYSIAIKQVKALEATLITAIEPILNPVWVFLIMGEAPAFWAIVGGAVIMVAILGRYILLQSTAKTNSCETN